MEVALLSPAPYPSPAHPILLPRQPSVARSAERARGENASRRLRLDRRELTGVHRQNEHRLPFFSGSPAFHFFFSRLARVLESPGRHDFICRHFTRCLSTSLPRLPLDGRMREREGFLSDTRSPDCDDI